MKESNILTFNNTPSDLTGFPEHWLCETVVEREVKILGDIRAWHIMNHRLKTEKDVRELEKNSPYALLPSKNIRFIREISFPVDEHVTIDDLKDIMPLLRQKFVIDCFQAAIDRRQHVARMVFDWYDRSHGSCVYLYPNKRVRLSVFLVRELDLPRPDGYEMWLRHFLQEDYKENPGIFQKMAEHVKHVRLGRQGYNIVRDALQYAELVCKNLIK
jgi:hypothetical protein